MTAETGKVVSINYTLKDKDGNIVDSSVGRFPLEFVQGANYLLPKLEAQIAGKNPGDTFSTVIAPADGYGEYDEEKVVQVPKSDFDTDVEIEVGMQFQAQTEDGGFALVTVKEVGDEFVTIDANHELAGKELHFQIEVLDVRDATEDELASGMVGGGCGGCGGSCGSCGEDCGDSCGCDGCCN